MARFTFDCYACDETLKTNDIEKVRAFGEEHKDCGVPA